MNESEAGYRRLCKPADQAVLLIQNNAKLVMGLGISQPNAILKAIADRARSGKLCNVELYYMLSLPPTESSVLHPDLVNFIRPSSLFFGPIERTLNQSGHIGRDALVKFIPTAFSQVPRVMCDMIGVDTLVTTVSPMNADGYFSLGTNTDYALSVSRIAKCIVVEVNPNMPRVSGNCNLHISRLSAIVESHTPLTEVPQAIRRPADEKIGRIIAGLISDGACIQMGIGAVPDAVSDALRNHKDLGIHTELMTPSLANLMRTGVVNNSRKTLHAGKSIFTFAMGNRSLYEFLDSNDSFEAYPVEYVNDPAIIARNQQMISVNATLEVDLHGACNSEMLDGMQYSGSGGQLDFVRGASAAPQGLSIIACHSTAAGGSVSRIVPRLSGSVTTPRNDVQIIVTEHGWANLRGKSLSERARALIGIADPHFRESLERSAFAENVG